MVAPPQSRLQSMLRAAVQSVQWTYSLFWRLCPQEGILEWSDGYYNGAIKTRKTVQPTAAEEEAVHRSHQLRELYDFLVAGESSHQSRRPSVMLSPEDLTECEWFYLMCVSFSFRPGVGWPGKAYEKQEHVWLVGTNEVDSKICPRAVLAKSASMQTLVCIPLLDGVVELGTVEWVEEDIGIVQHIKSFFTDFHVKPALSDHSTSRPSVSFPPQTDGCHVSQDKEGDDATESDQTGGSDGQSVYDTSHQAAEGDELIMQQLDISMDIRVGSQDQGLNDLDSDFSLSMGTTPPKNSFDLRHEEEVYAPAEAVQRWQTIQPCHSGTQTVISCFHEPTQEDAHHSHTVSTELQPTQWQNSSSTTTAFTKYSAATGHHRGRVHSSQRVLKYILFTVPFLHTKSNDSSASTAQEQSSGSHVLAERRRREKLNERFVMLRSLIPFVTKMDKASILGDAIEYLKQLVEKIQELEAEPKQRNFKEKRGVSLRDKKRRRISEDVGGRKNPAPPHTAEQVEVSIIESEALVEIKCSHKEGLLMNVIQVLRKFKIEVTSVRSSVENGIFASELRAKVRDGVKGRKPTIMEVKRAINRII